MKLVIKLYRYFKYGRLYLVPVPMPGVFVFVDENGDPLAVYNNTQDLWESDMPIADNNFFWRQ